MGQARIRGTREQRVEQAIERRAREAQEASECARVQRLADEERRERWDEQHTYVFKPSDPSADQDWDSICWVTVPSGISFAIKHVGAGAYTSEGTPFNDLPTDICNLVHGYFRALERMPAEERMDFVKSIPALKVVTTNHNVNAATRAEARELGILEKLPPEGPKHSAFGRRLGKSHMSSLAASALVLAGLSAAAIGRP